MSWQPVSAAPMTQTRSGRARQAAHVLEGQGQLGARDRQPRGPPADGDDDPVGTPGPAVRRCDGVGVEEARVAGLLHEVDAPGADVVGDVLPLVRVAGHALRVGQRRGEVHLRPRPAQTERLPRAPVAHEARRPGQCAHRRRPLVEARAAHPPPLDERDLGPQLGGVERGGYSRGPASDHEDAHCPLPSRRRGHVEDDLDVLGLPLERFRPLLGRRRRLISRPSQSGSAGQSARLGISGSSTASAARF